MKINKQPRLTLLTLLFICSTALFTSCSKDNNNTPDKGTTHVKVVNAVEGSASQDLYLDNTKLTTSAVAYGSSSNYYSTSAGNHSAQFSDSGTTTVNAAFSASFGSDNFYSVYYTSDNSSKTGIVVANDQTAPQSGDARVRFIQLSSAISTLADIGTNKSTSKLATKLSYKTVTSYYDVDPNSTFSVYTSGSASLLLSVPTELLAGKIYTIFISGSTTATLSYHVVIDND